MAKGLNFTDFGSSNTKLQMKTGAHKRAAGPYTVAAPRWLGPSPSSPGIVWCLLSQHHLLSTSYPPPSSGSASCPPPAHFLPLPTQPSPWHLTAATLRAAAPRWPPGPWPSRRGDGRRPLLPYFLCTSSLGWPAASCGGPAAITVLSMQPGLERPPRGNGGGYQEPLRDAEPSSLCCCCSTKITN